MKQVTLVQMLSSEFCEIFQSKLFAEHLRAIASATSIWYINNQKSAAL